MPLRGLKANKRRKVSDEEGFRTIGRSLPLSGRSANWFIRLDRRDGDEPDHGIHSRATLSFIYRGASAQRSEISVGIAVENGTKTSFGIHYNQGGGGEEGGRPIKFATIGFYVHRIDQSVGFRSAAVSGVNVSRVSCCAIDESIPFFHSFSFRFALYRFVWKLTATFDST